MLLMEPPPSQGEIRFSLFRIPVRVHPFFWLVSILMGLRPETDLFTLIAWVVACFVGILVHELGHALVMRFYGHYPHIVLYGMGGLASPGLGAGHPGRDAQIAICAAGPAAGFLLAAVICGLLQAIGPGVEIDVGWPQLIHLSVDTRLFILRLGEFINSLLFISVWWGIMNLLPVLPLDGGQICDEVCNIVRPYDGSRVALMISCVTGVLVAVTALVQWRSIWIAVLFGYFAYQSFLLLSQGGYRRW